MDKLERKNEKLEKAEEIEFDFQNFKQMCTQLGNRNKSNKNQVYATWNSKEHKRGTKVLK